MIIYSIILFFVMRFALEIGMSVNNSPRRHFIKENVSLHLMTQFRGVAEIAWELHRSILRREKC
jgi:hypothetical protein